jgi:hypothetical protein
MLMNVICFASVYYAMIRLMFPAGPTLASPLIRGHMTWWCRGKQGKRIRSA